MQLILPMANDLSRLVATGAKDFPQCDATVRELIRAMVKVRPRPPHRNALSWSRRSCCHCNPQRLCTPLLSPLRLALSEYQVVFLFSEPLQPLPL